MGLPEIRKKIGSILRTERAPIREFLAEFLGTFMLVLIGDGAVAQLVFSKGTHGSFLSVNFAYALAIAFGVYICGGVSGGHINPAISLAMALIGRLDWIKVPIYWAGQTLGAFTASIVLFLAYFDALRHHDGGTRHTLGDNKSAGIWATYPSEKWLYPANLLFDQIVGTAILSLCVMAITDKRNMEVPKHFVPLLVGLVVGAIGMAFGYNCGYAINPARDFGPRIFTAIFGWGADVFTAHRVFFWIPILGPFIGAIIGVLLYLAFIGNHWPVQKEEEQALEMTKKKFYIIEQKQTSPEQPEQVVLVEAKQKDVV